MMDVVFLVADRNIEFAIRGFLERDGASLSLGTAPFSWKLFVAAGQHDPGLYVRARDLLQPHEGTFEHAVVIMDAAWEGAPPKAEIESRLADHLRAAGWPPSAGLGLVIEPEIETWLWTSGPHTASVLGWESADALRSALDEAGLWHAGERKPSDPKAAVDWAVRREGLPRSSSLYRAFAACVSLERCEDPSLRALLAALRRWFPTREA